MYFLFLLNGRYFREQTVKVFSPETLLWFAIGISDIFRYMVEGVLILKR